MGAGLLLISVTSPVGAGLPAVPATVIRTVTAWEIATLAGDTATVIAGVARGKGVTRTVADPELLL